MGGVRMRGYEIIQEEGKWFFRFVPNNNKGQNVGWSKHYSSYDECLRAVEQLRRLIIENQIHTLDSHFVRTVKNENGICLEYHIEDDVLYQTRAYFGRAAKTNCAKAVKSIYRHLDEYTLKYVGEGK